MEVGESPVSARRDAYLAVSSHDGGGRKMRARVSALRPALLIVQPVRVDTSNCSNSACDWAALNHQSV